MKTLLALLVLTSPLHGQYFNDRHYAAPVQLTVMQKDSDVTECLTSTELVAAGVLDSSAFYGVTQDRPNELTLFGEAEERVHLCVEGKRNGMWLVEDSKNALLNYEERHHPRYIRWLYPVFPPKTK